MKKLLNTLTLALAYAVCTILWLIGQPASLLADVCQIGIDYVLSIPDCENPDCDFHSAKK